MSERCRSTKAFLIQEHYRDLAEDLTWNTNRFHRLCAALQLNSDEMAALLRVPPAVLRRSAASGRFTGTVELHLTLIERSVFPSNQPPVFPALP